MTKLKTLLLAGLCVLMVSGGQAQINVPNTLVPGTTITSSALNTNFTTIGNAALNRTGGTMTGTLTSQVVVPSASNTYDLGSSSAFYRTGYVKTSLVLGQTTANYTLTWANPASARAISFEDPGGTDVLVYKAATQTLTNKTITAPVLGGTVTGTYTLGGTPTLTAPTFTGVYTLGGTPTIPASGLTGTITSSTQDLITRLGTIVSGVWNAGAVTSSGNVSVPSGSKIFIDGGGDTYAIENGANNYSIVAGGSTAFSVTNTSVLANNTTLKASGQPGFLAYNSADDSTQSTGAKVDFDTEVYDETNNFSADTFTAPVTGRYLFTAAVYTHNSSVAGNRALMLVTSNRSYYSTINSANTFDALTTTLSVIADMDAGDTAFVQLELNGGTVDIMGGGAFHITFFSGRLLP